MSSIVIIAKGPSVLKCNKQFIDSFSQVAIINYPVYTGYEKYISNHADYHFCMTYCSDKMDFTCNDIKKYYLDNTLGIKEICNVGNQDRDMHSKYYKNKKIKWDFKFRMKHNNRKQFDWFLPAGILALDYFLKNKTYKRIGLVGFDFFSSDNKLYYFSDNIEMAKTRFPEFWKDKYKKPQKTNSHNPDKQIKYVIDAIKNNKNIKFELYTNYKKFPKLKNLTVL